MKLPVGIQAFVLYISRFLGEKIALFLPPIPYHATIKITERCNSRCLTCSSWKMASSGELSFEEIRDYYAQLKSAGTRSVTLTGGEPLLRPDLPDMFGKTRRVQDIFGYKRIIAGKICPGDR
jgi:MoaA/NifB/PqqE/SkfB family radical SAM enzyme